MGTTTLTHLVILGIGLFCLFVWLSGCETLETQPDRITVNVMTSIRVILLDEQNNQIENSVDGVSVTIEIIKDRKDRLVFQRIVQNGLCQATASFVLSKGQFIECTATIQEGYQGFHPVAPGVATLAWETAIASVNMGGVYNWYPEILLHMKQ
jgi:hypothetical protein